MILDAIKAELDICESILKETNIGKVNEPKTYLKTNDKTYLINLVKFRRQELIEMRLKRKNG